MFTIEEFLRISNQMRDYYAKKIKDSFQEFNFSPNEISILIILKNNSTITTSTELKVVLGVSKTLIGEKRANSYLYRWKRYSNTSFTINR